VRNHIFFKSIMDIDSLKTFNIGDIYNGFQVTKSQAISELRCYLTELVHIQSKTEILHIANEDPENFFCLSFRTLPSSSNGIAHILEHVVLCGSKKYPVKDPFFAMNRRSLNTFMNALTGADFTCYPAASQVEADFYNLLEVYLDAVFNPLLTKISFSQEGYRLEFANPEDPNTCLQFKGIVYNEMKGALTSATTRLVEEVNASLFPESPYGHNSGGDPEKIPDLTYDELLLFHKNYYHPSRSLFFFSGNFPLKKHLDFISDKVLVNARPLPKLPPIPPQPRFLKPVYKDFFYPIAPDEPTESKVIVCFAWLTCHIHDQMTLLMLSILDIILMDTDASILKKELLRSGFCKQAHSMMDSEIAQIPYGLIVKGVNEKDVLHIESIIFNTLERLAREGIDPSRIDTALHQLELQRSEITGDSAPFGLSLFYRSGLLKQHGVNAEDGLRIHSLFDELRAKFKENPRFLSDVLTTYLLNNRHFVRVSGHPSQDLAQIETARELERLATIQKSLTLTQQEALIDHAIALKAFQDSDEAEEKFELLPKVHIRDVSKFARNIELTHSHHENLELFHHHAFTNKITYATLVFDIPETKESDLWLLRLFSTLMPQLGCRNQSYHETLDRIQEHTGGIVSYLSINHQAHDAAHFSPSFYLRGKAMYHKSKELFSILYDMITAVNCTDRDRVKELLLKHYTNLQSSLASNALKYAMNLSASSVNVAGKILQSWYGLGYLYKIKELVQNIDEILDRVIVDLERIKEHLLYQNIPHLVLSCEKTEVAKYLETGFEGIQELPVRAHAPWKEDYSLQKLPPQAKIIASHVAFTSKICKSLSYIHPDSAAISLATFLFDNLVIHKRVREQGGAYGSGSISSPMSATFCFYAYRDPNIASTLTAFDEALDCIQSGKFDEDDLEEAKLEMIQHLDAPIAPGSRADVAYSWYKEGKTHDMRQAFRNRILAMQKADISSAVQKHLVPNMQQAASVCFASKELLEKENNELIKMKNTPFHIENVWI